MSPDINLFKLLDMFLGDEVKEEGRTITTFRDT